MGWSATFQRNLTHTDSTTDLALALVLALQHFEVHFSSGVSPVVVVIVAEVFLFVCFVCLCAW